MLVVGVTGDSLVNEDSMTTTLVTMTGTVCVLVGLKYLVMVLDGGVVFVVLVFMAGRLRLGGCF